MVYYFTPSVIQERMFIVVFIYLRIFCLTFKHFVPKIYAVYANCLTK